MARLLTIRDIHTCGVLTMKFYCLVGITLRSWEPNAEYPKRDDNYVQYKHCGCKVKTFEPNTYRFLSLKNLLSERQTCEVAQNEFHTQKQHVHYSDGKNIIIVNALNTPITGILVVRYVFVKRKYFTSKCRLYYW